MSEDISPLDLLPRDRFDNFGEAAGLYGNELHRLEEGDDGKIGRHPHADEAIEIYKDHLEAAFQEMAKSDKEHVRKLGEAVLSGDLVIGWFNWSV